MPAPIRITEHIEIPASEFSLSFSRASGAGGQNVNKVNSKVSLRWAPAFTRALKPDQIKRLLERFATQVTAAGEIVISSSVHRDQARNIDECRKKLAAMVRSILKPPKKRVPTKVSRAVKEKILRFKKHHSQKKQTRRKVTQD